MAPYILSDLVVEKVAGWVLVDKGSFAVLEQMVKHISDTAV
jgi:hypothetical protein